MSHSGAPGKGVAVHSRTCPNVQNLLYESDRRIQVEWAPIPGDTRPITYRISA